MSNFVAARRSLRAHEAQLLVSASAA